MYHRELESNHKASVEHQHRLKTAAKDRLKTVAAKVKRNKKDKA